MEKRFFQAPTVYVGELSLNVMDLERSLHFYKEFLGFKVLEQEGNSVTLTANGKNALITLVQPEDVEPKAGKTTGLYHLAILLPSRSDLAAFLNHLGQHAGNLGLGASDHEVSEALYFDDPDGNGIEIAVDRPAAEWSWNNDQVYMTTVALNAESVMKDFKSPWQGMPAETVIGHMHLHVADIAAAKNFIENGLNFDVVLNFHGAIFTSDNGYHHHIAMNQWNGPNAPRPTRNSVGLNWFSLVFPTEEKRSQVVQNLRKINAPVREEGQDYLTEDPAGNRIRLVIG